MEVALDEVAQFAHIAGPVISSKSAARRRRHFADLVEEQRAAVRMQEHPLTRPVGERVQRARGDLLTRTGLTRQQNGGRQRRNAGDRLAHPGDGRGFADQPVAQEDMVGRRLQLIAKHIVLALQANAVETTCDGVEQLVGAEGLEDEIDGTGAQCLDGCFEIGIGGHQNGVCEEADGPLLGQPFHAVLLRHDIVENDDVEVMLIELQRGFARVCSQFQQFAPWPERTHEEVAHPRLVVDDENGGLRQPGAELRIG